MYFFCRQFWSEIEPVVIEADAFKETDVVYQALNSIGPYDDMLQRAELVIIFVLNLILNS